MQFAQLARKFWVVLMSCPTFATNIGTQVFPLMMDKNAFAKTWLGLRKFFSLFVKAVNGKRWDV
jgi:hypothetical protein